MSDRNTILVTGGMGYIGSHTIIELLENSSFKVISIDNFSNSSPQTLDRIESITHKKITNYSVDICDKKALKAVFEKESTIVGVIHFAAYKSVPESVENPHKYYENNINSLLNILECCLTYSIDNFIFSSSCSVYGNIEKLPVSESTPFEKAESPYAYTKQVGEQMIKDYARTFPKLKTISLRYFNPVGAHISGLIGEDPINPPTSLLPIITQTAIGQREQMTVHGNNYDTRDGSCVRDYIHVTDIAIAHIKALEFLIENKQTSNNSVFNLGTGEGVSVLEAINTFEESTQEKLNYSIGPRRAGDVVEIYSDTKLSSEILGWKTVFSLNEMMTSAWKWQLNLQNK